MNNQYPLNYINQSAQYQKRIFIGLWENLKQEFKNLDVDSFNQRYSPNHNTPQSQNEPSPTEIFANLSPKELERFMTSCWILDKKQFETEYSKDYKIEERQKIQQLFRSHQVTLLSSEGNSRNIKIEKMIPDGNPPMILKIDVRLNRPKTVEQALRRKGFNHFTSLIGEERHSKFRKIVREESKMTKEYVVGTLLLTEFCPNGDLRTKSQNMHKENTRNPKIITDTIDYFQQMGNIMIDLQDKGAVFPDAKNSNWLIDENNRLKISDTKSLMFTTDNQQIDPDDTKNQWTKGLVYSRHLLPPDMINLARGEQIAVDPLHAYMLGKNLYEFLTNCDYNFLLDMLPPEDMDSGRSAKYSFNEDDFNHPVFKTEGGRELKELIQMMVKPEPEERISLAQAVKSLNDISRKLDIQQTVQNTQSNTEQTSTIDLSMSQDTKSNASQQKNVSAHQHVSTDKKGVLTDTSKKTTSMRNSLAEMKKKVSKNYDQEEREENLNSTSMKNIN
tara:strand:- start:1548 stop:3053 length:1506 start_codon:yes stop_codon:yes gene_type:complete